VTLTELLDELRTNLLRDASTLKTGTPDQYWDDLTLVRYMNDAHRRFARRSLCIRDDTTAEVVQVRLAADTAMYTLHPSVLRVQSARHEDATTDLVRMTHATNYTFANTFTDYFDIAGSPRSGEPKRFATDEGVQVDDEHQIRMLVDPVPDSTQGGKLVALRVIRLPLNALSLDNTDASPEIPEDWQLDMLEWAAFRALRNWDVDAEAQTRAKEHKDRFEEAVLECRQEVEQKKMFEPVTWKFGGNGFSYTR
jgi:hypothetical protein